MAYAEILASYLSLVGTTSILSTPLAVFSAAGVLVAVIVSWWAALLPRLAVAFLLATLVIGQLVRFPLPGQGGGLLLSDLAVVLVLLAAVFRVARQPTTYSPHSSSGGAGNLTTHNYSLLVTRYSLLFTPFILWSLFTLLINTQSLSGGQLLVSFVYWLRLALYLLVLPALVVLTRGRQLKKFLEVGFIIAVWILVLVGFAQLLFAPSFASLPAFWRLPTDYLVRAGWDPHQGRLVSTWLDPNFFGAFLVVVLPLLLLRPSKKLVLKWTLVVLLLVALAFTQSRSSLIAAAIGWLMFSPLLLIQLLPVRASVPVRIRFIAMTGFLVAWLLVAGLLLGDRLPGLWQQDATVSVRKEALQAVWSDLAERHSLLGTGYNTYQYAAAEAGLINSFSLHSRAGADNSWLTLWVTTGIVGVILFLLPWVALCRRAMRSWNYGNKMALTAVTAFSSLFIHSQFVNSFLYSHLLLTLIIVFALVLGGSSAESEVSNEA